MKRAALYMRVSTVDQHPETQLHDLRQMAAQRGYQIVQEYTDKITGAKAKRPGLDLMMAMPAAAEFDVVLVWACDRIARSTRHFLEVLDELNRLGSRVRQLPRTDRYRRPAGPRHRDDHRRDRRTRTQSHRRAGPRRHAARPPRRPTHRPNSTGTGQRRHPARSSAWPEHPTDRKRTSRLDGDNPTRPQEDSLIGHFQPCDKRGLKNDPPNPT